MLNTLKTMFAEANKNGNHPLWGAITLLIIILAFALLIHIAAQVRTGNTTDQGIPLNTEMLQAPTSLQQWNP